MVSNGTQIQRKRFQAKAAGERFRRYSRCKIRVHGRTDICISIGKVMVDRDGTVTNEATSIEVFQNVAIALKLRGFEPKGGLGQVV